MVGIEYLVAALSVISHLQGWIDTHDPSRTEPLTWPEVTSNIDHLANNEHNQDAITMLVADYFSDNPSKALRVARCESNLRPTAFNGAGPYIGIFQIENGSFDARENVAHARRMYNARGWQPWPECGRL